MATEAASRSYSAFISYRHADVDTRVAKEVHHKLERYHLDREVRERSGRKSLAPVFRDQDELPISSALDDDLVAALRNSSTLIVICSPRTKESMWVDREISEFLKTHDRSRVLVALCEGEPRDVIPERLLHKEGPDGQVVDVEPLAANFRKEVTGQARRNEVSQLAAGILEVPYDSLVKRAQRRRQRIGAALASAAVAASSMFGLYNAYMNAQIKNNYHQAMLRRSQYLAGEATNLIDEGNTIGATELALAALPDVASPETLSRPVVPEAVHALQRATNAGVFGTLLERSFTTTEVYGSVADLRSFDVSPDGSHVVTVDESDFVTTWDVASHTVIYQGRSSLGRYEEVVAAFALDSGETLIVYRDGVVLRRTDGEVGWDRAFTTDDAAIQRVCLDEATRTKLLTVSSTAAYVLDVATGEVVKTISFDTLVPVGADGWTNVLCSAHSRANRFVFSVSYGDETGFLGCRALVVDADTLDVQVFETDGLYAYYVGLLSDGSVVTLTGSDPEAQVSDTGVAYATTYTKTLDFALNLACFDAETKSLRWENPFTIWEVSFGIGLEEQLSDAGSMLVCWLSDRVLFVDAQTGEVKNELKCSSPLVGGGLIEEGRSFMGVERDGSLFMVTADSDSVMAHDLMGNDLYTAKVLPTGELYLIKNNYLYAYRGPIVNASVSTVAVEQAKETWEFAADEGFVLASIIEERDVLRVELRDALTLDLTWEQELGDLLLWYVLAFDEEADCLVVAGADVNEDGYPVRKVARLQVGAQEVERTDVAHELPADLTIPRAGEAAVSRDSLVVGAGATYSNGVVFSQVSDAAGHVGIAAALLDEGTTNVYGVEEGFGAELSPGGKRLFLLADPAATRVFYQDAVGSQEGESGLVTSQSAVLDLTSGATLKLDELVASIWDGTLPSRALKGHAAWSDDGSRLACVCSDGLVIYRFDRRPATRIALDGTRVDGTWLDEGRVVVALSSGSTGQLEAYSTDTGELLATHPFDDGGEWVYQWTRVPKALAADGSGDLFVSTPVNGLLIDLDTLGVCQSFAGGCAYHPVYDAILCQGVNKASYHAHQRYSLPLLVERGRVILGPQTMGEEWLFAHGA